MSDTSGGGVMGKIKNNPFLMALIGFLFTLTLGSYAYTYTESDKKIEKDTFNLFLTEYRNNTDRIFQLLKK